MAAKGEKNIKLVLVGSGAVGKTHLRKKFLTNETPAEFAPTVFEHETANIKIGDAQVCLQIWDVSGIEGYERIRALAFPNTEVLALCFSAGERKSFEDITTRWLPELAVQCPSVPIILVATKIDLREHPDHVDSAVSPNEGRELTEKIKAILYLECSAETGIGVTEVFEEAARALLPTTTEKKEKRGFRALFH